MPTPFMHLHAAHRFLNDTSVSEGIRQTLSSDAHLGAFLLGNVAPDARVSGGQKRAVTHFFDYRPTVNPDAGDALLIAYPHLGKVNGAHRAFIAGYIAHLTLDVVWCEDILFPHFYFKQWGNEETRFIILHVLLSHLDARDYRQWDDQYYAALSSAAPDQWIPVLPDTDLIGWKNLVAEQICDTCESQTIPVLGSRITVGEAGLRAILSSEERMQDELWQHVPPQVVEETEVKMYQRMVDWIVRYMTESEK